MERVTGRGRGRVTGRGVPGAGRRGIAAGVLLAASLAVAGCGASDEGVTQTGARADARADRGAAAPQEGARQSAGTAGQDGAPKPGATDGGATAGDDTSAAKAAKAAAAQIIRTATVTVRTKDVPAAVARARAAAEGAGGYVGDESTDQDSAGHDRSRLVLRVPPEEYDKVLGRLSGLGKLVSREVSAKDVTEQVVDIDSRVSSQRASVTRVRKLMEKATTISDIVALESELNTRQSNLESLQAQLKSLKERTGTATVTLLLREPDAAPDRKPGSGDGPTSFGDALSGGWHAFTAAVRWVLVVLGAVLPFAVAAGVLYALWRLVRDRLPAALVPRRRRPVPGPRRAPAKADATREEPARTAAPGGPSGEPTAPSAPEGGQGPR